MKVYSITLLIFLLLVSIAPAQDSLEQVLEPDDVEHFIETFPKLQADFENYGIEMDSKGGTMTFPEALEAQNEFMKILKTHGWDENYFRKAGVILFGYSALVYDVEKVKADSSFNASFQEIESNPNLSDAIKEQLKEQLKTAQGVISDQQSVITSKIHPTDLELVKSHEEDLKKLFDEEE